jgi:lipopolysaccharide assembly outer membrane protein LptD (OstA)
MVTGYQYENNLDAALAEEDFQHLAWRASIDQRFTLTAGEGSSKHQLIPRFYYAYAPLTDQQAPVLDTKVESGFTLFSNSRFSGVDRTGDLSRFSTSLSYEYGVNNQSLYKLGVDKGVKLQQERLTLTGTDEVDPDWMPEFSDWKLRGELNLTESLSFKGSAALDHASKEYNSFATEINYSPAENVFVNLQAEKDDDGHSFKAGTYYPLLQNLAFIGYANFETDAEQPQWQDFRTKELLFGLDIDSCCWNLRFALLETAAAEDEDGNSIFLENSQIAPYFEFTLKGIGAGTGTIEDILKRLDFGYTGRLFNYR